MKVVSQTPRLSFVHLFSMFTAWALFQWTGPQDTPECHHDACEGEGQRVQDGDFHGYHHGIAMGPYRS